MKILIADSFPKTHASELEQMGHICTIEPGLDENSLTSAITDQELLIVRSTAVNAATLNSGSNLKLVIRAGAGTNTIDKQYAADKGIRVCNVPGANAIAVAQLVMGMIIALDRNIVDNVIDLRNKTWNKKKFSKARGLYGQKLGIVGFGAIGLALAQRAQAFGIEVFAIDQPGVATQRMVDAGIVELDKIEQILEICDIVSLHMPATDETRGMVNKTFLDQLKDGAILINAARGELVDEAALITAMNEKGIRAGLDVYDNEPGPGDSKFDSALASHGNVCGTHHIGASTEQAQTAVADGVLKVIAAYESGELINCVNA